MSVKTKAELTQRQHEFYPKRKPRIVKTPWPVTRDPILSMPAPRS